MEKRLTFDYGRTLILSRLFLFVGLLVVVLATVAISPSFSVLYMALLGIVLVVYFVVFALSPLLTQHWITRSRIILRQGWYFRAVIPFAEIDRVTLAEDVGRTKVPLGIHRPFGQPALFVTGGRTNLAAIRLREPRRFWQAFGLSATEVVFDVLDPPAFLTAFEERRGLLPPVQSHRANAELRD
ncbi:MAG: hypothetical protein L3J78_02880 [Thermoplasmata archaeon]|nr:hypothetical protein [Thermoplasmata archaeon]